MASGGTASVPPNDCGCCSTGEGDRGQAIGGLAIGWNTANPLPPPHLQAGDCAHALPARPNSPPALLSTAVLGSAGPPHDGTKGAADPEGQQPVRGTTAAAPSAVDALLLEAAADGDTAALAAALAAGAGVDCADASGETALMRAAALGHTACLQALLGAGAAPEACDSHGHSALHWCVAAPAGPRLTAAVALQPRRPATSGSFRLPPH